MKSTNVKSNNIESNHIKSNHIIHNDSFSILIFIAINNIFMIVISELISLLKMRWQQHMFIARNIHIYSQKLAKVSEVRDPYDLLILR